jgi:hypothetical protein
MMVLMHLPYARSEMKKSLDRQLEFDFMKEERISVKILGNLSYVGAIGLTIATFYLLKTMWFPRSKQ